MDSEENTKSQEDILPEECPENPSTKRKHEEDEEDERKTKAGCQRDDDPIPDEPAVFDPGTPKRSPTPEHSDLAEILKQGVALEKPINLAEILPNPPSPSSSAETEIQLPEAKITPEFDISEKLKEMGEISVQPVSKSDTKKTQEVDKDEVSVEITKKGSDESEDKRKFTNLRKNIREVMDDNQLDASTLAAQREELERLARVQEQQKIMRAVQRQIDADKLNSKMQSKVISLLQGHTSLLKSSAGQTSVAGTSGGAVLMKVPTCDPRTRMANLTPSVSIAPVRGPVVRRDTLEDEEEREMKINAQIEAEEAAEKEALQSARREVVTIVDSSSEDDCIVLSDDDEEEEETDEDPHNSGIHVRDAYNIPDDQGRVVVNIGHPENEPDVFVAPQIARIMKPHQIGGVRFLYDNIIESLERFDTSTGFGCILAHSMGLGKTLQLVCFCDIFLRHTSSKTVLCIMPVNTLQNWIAEFNMWLPENAEKSPLSGHGDVRTRNFKIHVLNDSHKSLSARSKVVMGWVREGGVLMIGYEMFRLLSLKKMTKKRSKRAENNPKLFEEQSEAHQKVLDEMYEALVKPGPDLIVCDEGHRIKNSHASISVALKQIRSKRRIVLTGYPLQNNLMEYWCMVDFVRPNYLGTKTEFANMFERPIQNGQCIDSTPNDIKLMRYRAHVLHSLLVGFVQRRSHMVLQCSLPQKEEYVLLVRMTKFQRELYEVFMNDVVRTKAVPNPLKAFAVCCKIWNHPDVLYNFLKKREADLDLEIEVAEAAAAAAAAAAANGEVVTPTGKKGTSPKKPKSKKATNNTKTIDMDGKMKPAATILPTTNTNVTASSSDEKAKTESVTNSAETQVKREVEDLPKEEPQVKSEAPEPNKQSQNPPYPYQYPNTYDSSYNQYPNQNMYGNNVQQTGYYQNQPYGDGYNYGSNAGMQYNQGNYWPNTNDYYQGNSQTYNYGNYENQYRDNRPYMMDQTNAAQQPSHNYNNQYPYNQDNQGSTWTPKDTADQVVEKPTTEDQSAAIVDMDTKEIKLEAKTTLPEAEETNPTEKDEEPAKDTKDEAADEAEKEISRLRDDVIPYDWAVELMKGYIPDLLENAPKMQIFFCILEESLRLGDRILVFSQSLLTLNLIEKFLQATTVTGSDVKWAKNTNYYRLDGSTSALDREKLINEFNSNPNIQIFLVSTRAGSLGINLVGANRVIVFDASWNPCHDTQAVCRVYRYGQKKPCFVYRLVMDNCLEKKIYDRQVNKQGMSDRVVDECNPDAHLSIKEVTSLCWDDDRETEEQDFAESKDKFIDVVMQKIIVDHSKLLSKEPFQHESLLVDRKEKKLSQAEKRLAQRGYELEKQASAKPSYGYNAVGTQYRAIRTPDGSIVHRPVASVRPMQSVMNDANYRQNMMNRQTRWIPAEVWQRQGMTAQEMTLPLDVVIPTSSSEKANIVLKAGQKVMVLKSPKGIYMQLETGKIIAIRTAFKVNHGKDEKQEGDGANRDGKKPMPIGAEMSDSETMALAGQGASVATEDRVIDLDKDSGGEGLEDIGATGGNQFPVNSTDKTPPGGNPYGKYIGPSLGGQSNYADQATLRPTNEAINHSGGINHNYPPFPPMGQPKIDEKDKGSNGTDDDKNNDDVIMLSPEPVDEVRKPPVPPYEGSYAGNQSYPQYPPYQQPNQPYAGYHGQSQYYPTHQPHSGGNSYNQGIQIPPGNATATQTSFTQQNIPQAPSIPPTITIDDDTDPPLRPKVVYKPNLVARSKKPPPIQPPQPYGMQNYGGGPSNPPFGNIPPKSPYRHQRTHPPMPPYYKQTPAYRPAGTPYDSYTGDFQQSSLSCLERTTSSIDESKSMYKATLSNITNSAPLSPPPSQIPSQSPGKSTTTRAAKPRNRRKTNNKSPALPTEKSPKGANGDAAVQQNVPGQYNPSHPPYYTTPLEYQGQVQQMDQRYPKESSHYGGDHYRQQPPDTESTYSTAASGGENTTNATTYAAPEQPAYGYEGPPVTGSAFHRPENTPTYTTPAANPEAAPSTEQYSGGQYQSSYIAPQQNPPYGYHPPPSGYYPPPAPTHPYPTSDEYDPARYQQPPVPHAPQDPQYSGSYAHSQYNYPPYPAPAGQETQSSGQWQ